MVIPNTGFCDQDFDSRSKGSSLPDSTVIFIWVFDEMDMLHLV